MRSAVQWGLHQRRRGVLCGRGIDCWGVGGTVNSVSFRGVGAIVQSVALGFQRFLSSIVYFRLQVRLVSSPIFGVVLRSHPSSTRVEVDTSAQ